MQKYLEQAPSVHGPALPWQECNALNLRNRGLGLAPFLNTFAFDKYLISYVFFAAPTNHKFHYPISHQAKDQCQRFPHISIKLFSQAEVPLLGKLGLLGNYSNECEEFVPVEKYRGDPLGCGRVSNNLNCVV